MLRSAPPQIKTDNNERPKMICHDFDRSSNPVSFKSSDGSRKNLKHKNAKRINPKWQTIISTNAASQPGLLFAPTIGHSVPAQNVKAVFEVPQNLCCINDEASVPVFTNLKAKIEITHATIGHAG